MNDRQRFLATMNYGARDRSPMVEFGYWSETIDRWHREGLPSSVTTPAALKWFGFDHALNYGLGDVSLTDVKVFLFPRFPAQVLEDRGELELFQQDDGVRVVRRKDMGSIPATDQHLLVDRQSWRTHYKPRLAPSSPGRYPDDWHGRVNTWRNPDRTFPIFLPGGSLYGWLRNWMGVEALSMVLYDDPAWFQEMVTTVADCIVGVLDHVLQTGSQFEACIIWEDMCYSGGPLISPAHFRQYLVPHYRRLTDLLRRYGVDLIAVDSDGRVDQLIPLWLDAGVNCILPIEVGTWGGDPLPLRRQFGRDLRIMGSFDKRLLRGAHSDIDAEVNRLLPLVEEGGYIPFCDHLVPPDVPLSGYLHYVETARRVWGCGKVLRPLNHVAEGRRVFQSRAPGEQMPPAGTMMRTVTARQQDTLGQSS